MSSSYWHEQSPLTLAQVDGLLRATFPVTCESELASLEYVTATQDGEAFRVVTRLIGWDAQPDGSRSITDIKEQEVWFDPHQSSLERLTIYMRAFVQVAAVALANPAVSYLMPHDLLITSPLSLSRAQTEEDFVRALSQRSRLGQYLSAIAPTDEA